MTTKSAASSGQQPTTTAIPAPRGFAAWRGVLFDGWVGGAVALYLCLVGIVPVFNGRPLVDTVISLGQASLLITFVGTGYIATLRAPSGKRQAIAAGAIAGALSGVVLSLLVLVGSVVDLRAVLLNASPDLYNILTAGMGTSGFWVPTAVGLLFGLLAGMSSTLPGNIRKSLFVGLSALVIMGLFAGLLRTPLLNGPLSDLGRFLFAQDGLTPVGAALTVVISVGAYQFQQRYRIERRIANMPADRRRTATVPLAIIVFLLVVALPQGLGPFFAQVIAIVAIYILMGFGLNITLGLAGLLDLGFVAFFAVGAYTVGLLTSTAEYGIADWSFWAAVPFAILAAMLFGAFLGLPILGIRGDYLAIATLGFGEIVRILAGSDLLKPVLGGPRGIINIPKPIDVPLDSWLSGPNQIYYIALACAAVVAFVAWRLRASRLGRAWVAIREDEDVAEAIGINLVQTKLLAYILGAGFAGLGGAIFAGLVGSIFASSIQVFVSINVAALIIVGGMGSIPGVVVGAIFLIGLPELFREFSEYRYLFYGVVLIAIMRFRPEGLLPSQIVKREFHVADSADNVDAPDAEPYGLIAEEEAS